jgi:hypothetical protein
MIKIRSYQKKTNETNQYLLTPHATSVVSFLGIPFSRILVRALSSVVYLIVIMKYINIKCNDVPDTDYSLLLAD